MRKRSSTDPMLMRNQPSLRTSSGTVWIVVGAVLVVAALIPLILLASAQGPSATTATITIVLVVVLYAALIIARFAAPSGPGRLRLMAGFFLASAGVALLGTALCAAMEWSAV